MMANAEIEVKHKIEKVERDIEAVKRDIEAVEKRLETDQSSDAVSYLRKKARQLRDIAIKLLDKESKLRDEKSELIKDKKRLREEENQRGSRAPKRWKPSPGMQAFVSSAAASYKKWKQDYEQALESHKKAVEKVGEEVADVKMHRPFLEVKADPLSSFTGGILLWVRDCYTDMKDILSAAARSERFTILGTSGIGKSMFSLFWICYWATLKKKVVWKVGGEFHLLDFTVEDSPMAYIVDLADQDVVEVLADENAWVVIDGGQREPLLWRCHILQEEVREFLDEFEQHRSSWQEMQVPEKEEALRYFGMIGGIPRFVLCGKQSEKRLTEIQTSIAKVDWDGSLDLFIGSFEGSETGDALVHIKCGKGEDLEDGGNEKYSSHVFDFASIYVRNLFGERFEELSEGNVLKFMRAYANDTSTGNQYGYLFEYVGHCIIKQGGQFQMKKVTQGKPAEGTEVELLELSKKELVFFDSWEIFPEFKLDGYYRPTQENLKSIDGVLHPDLLLQFFSRTRSTHGYIVQGLQDAAEALKLKKLRVCAVVPKDKYDRTGFQPWLTTGKTKYINPLPEVIVDSEQYVIAIDFNKLRSPQVL